MTKGQEFVVCWAAGAMAYLCAFGVAVLLAFPSIEDPGALEGLHDLGEVIAGVLMVPGKWLLPDQWLVSEPPLNMLTFALFVAINLACWGLLLPLTWLGLRRIARTVH